MKQNKLYIIFIFLAFTFGDLKAQLLPVDTAFNPTKFGIIAGSEAVVWSISLIGLNQLWYSDYEKEDWHTFNDNGEWMQMDKVGHASTAFILGRSIFDAYKFTGVNETQAIWIGGLSGFLFLSSIEILDGYSQNWGFSWGDIAANGIGTSLFMAQQFIWHQQRIKLKYSFHTTTYAEMRPDLLGNNLSSQMLKDYNGQTYWLDVNISNFLKGDSKFPKWITFSFGYGAEGMLGAFSNPTEYSDIPKYRQYYLSFDIDYTRIKTNSKILKSLFTVLSFIKTPLPTLEYSQNKLIIHPLYF